MKFTILQEKVLFIAPVLIALLMFFIPVSSTIKSIFFVLSLLALLATPQYRKHLFYAYSTLWAWAGIVFFVYVLIASLWSEAPLSIQWNVISKYAKLIVLPLFAVGFINSRTRAWTLNSYLAAMFLTCIISILKSKNMWFAGADPDPGQVYYNHIITGFMVALGAYLAGLFAFQMKGWRRFVFIFLLLLSSYQILFLNSGRTGYVVYFILMTLLFFQILSIKQAAIGVLLFSVLLILVYNQSAVLQSRTHALINDLVSLKNHEQNNSIGFRIQFHHYAQSLFKEQPVIGIGTGGFKYRFSQDNPVPQWGKSLTDPHSQYWLILAEQGLLGMVFLILFIGTLFFTALQLQETRPILLGILIAFCIGCISDTILCYSTIGYLLILLSALCFGELLEKRILST